MSLKNISVRLVKFGKGIFTVLAFHIVCVFMIIPGHVDFFVCVRLMQYSKMPLESVNFVLLLSKLG